MLAMADSRVIFLSCLALREVDDADEGKSEDVSERKDIDWLYAETVFSFSDIKRM